MYTIVPGDHLWLKLTINHNSTNIKIITQPYNSNLNYRPVFSTQNQESYLYCNEKYKYKMHMIHSEWIESCVTRPLPGGRASK